MKAKIEKTHWIVLLTFSVLKKSANNTIFPVWVFAKIPFLNKNVWASKIPPTRLSNIPVIKDSWKFFFKIFCINKTYF